RYHRHAGSDRRAAGDHPRAVTKSLRNLKTFVRYLIISDLHSNREALEAVLDNARGEYDRIVCCGDLAGYGPDPNCVIDWARANLYAVIRGNHDRGCSGTENLEWFNPV